jgi:hypothetical protein
MALGDGIVVAILLDAIWRSLTKKFKVLASVKNVAIALGILLFFTPVYIAKAHPQYLTAIGYLQGESPLLYQFLQHQPKDSVIASLTKEGDFIPSLAQRSVLVAQEYAIPYHQGYYQQIKQRTKDLIAAQYSNNFRELKQFIQQYKINLWLLDRHAFEREYLEKNRWISQFILEKNRAISSLENQSKPIIQKLQSQCQNFADKNSILLETKCLLANSKQS